MGRLWIISMVFCLGLVASANDVDRLLGLAAELRQLRTERQALDSQWHGQRQQLELEIEIAEKELERSRASLEEVEQQLAAIVRELEQVAVRRKAASAEQAALELSMSSWTAAFDHTSAACPILFDSSETVPVSDGESLANRLAVFFNNYLMLAENATVCEVRKAEITTAGVARRVDLLRLGGVYEYYVAPDGACAMRDNSGAWVPLADGWAAHLRATMRVVRREVPARVIVVPTGTLSQ
ncbi:MAG: DUF3450 family protein [Lentisphaeria bacterium]|jgi:hypothetical protein|nr:DUF3450 family protein [Lentisphaeria bacterium]MDP7742440.1 DUF3450 family protein [Lentisphaeria bacterium]